MYMLPEICRHSLFAYDIAHFSCFHVVIHIKLGFYLASGSSLLHSHEQANSIKE